MCVAAACRKIREWQVGVALFSVGNVANFISFGEQLLEEPATSTLLRSDSAAVGSVIKSSIMLR
jgi:hypothetical protein